jgi:ligand-binding SRPBCC domain-containing protein
MRWYRLETEQVVTAGLEATFGFFADAGNLETITPPFLRFRIVTPRPIAMAEGTLIEYRLRLRGVPIRWLTRIDAWEPGAGFVDRQLAGPYAAWIHHHTFAPHPRGTLVRDRVDYALPLDPWSRPLHPLLVRPDLERIFRYRRDAVVRALGAG